MCLRVAPPAFLPTLLVVAFTGQHFHFTHCSVESEVCLLILPLKTVCLLSLRLMMSASQRKTLSIYDFDEDDDAESVNSEVSKSDKPVPNSLAALNALETLTAYFEAKSSNPDGALKMIYGLYESVHDVNKEISVQSKMTDFFQKK